MNKIHESTKQLRAAGIKFTTTDAGHSMLLTHRNIEVQFWPVTGKFLPRAKSNQHLPIVGDQRGVDAVIKYLKGA